MKYVSAGSRQPGSLIAGVLIGVSIVFGVFAVTATETNYLQIVLAFGSPTVLVLGLLLQIVITAQSRPHVPEDVFGILTDESQRKTRAWPSTAPVANPELTHYGDAGVRGKVERGNAGANWTTIKAV